MLRPDGIPLCGVCKVRFYDCYCPQNSDIKNKSHQIQVYRKNISEFRVGSVRLVQKAQLDNQKARDKSKEAQRLKNEICAHRKAIVRDKTNCEHHMNQINLLVEENGLLEQLRFHIDEHERLSSNIIRHADEISSHAAEITLLENEKSNFIQESQRGLEHARRLCREIRETNQELRHAWQEFTRLFRERRHAWNRFYDTTCCHCTTSEQRRYIGNAILMVRRPPMKQLQMQYITPGRMDLDWHGSA
ncbi:hypothetical protein BS50DRAFT_634987 [Corynespora cassiicola Philippines]|uniref:Uncharacterized protein n=1 Tax=Corynespora cassiicola Philippines TaxID=1448308 RepID=A0A2T2NJZ6_CORCC|nr:hypothetical protein BS50DRAFT_634987 [Corynespora cassiicola Philippines]